MSMMLFSVAHHFATENQATLLLSQLHMCKVVDSAHLDELAGWLAGLLTTIVKVCWKAQFLMILTLHLCAMSYPRSVLIMRMAGSKREKQAI